MLQLPADPCFQESPAQVSIAGLTGNGHGVKLPGFFACGDIVGGKEAANAILPAGRPQHHFVLYHQGSFRDGVTQLRIGDLISQSTCPFFASSATRCASIVPMNRVSP